MLPFAVPRGGTLAPHISRKWRYCCHTNQYFGESEHSFYWQLPRTDACHTWFCGYARAKIKRSVVNVTSPVRVMVSVLIIRMLRRYCRRATSTRVLKSQIRNHGNQRWITDTWLQDNIEINRNIFDNARINRFGSIAVQK